MGILATGVRTGEIINNTELKITALGTMVRSDMYNSWCISISISIASASIGINQHQHQSVIRPLVHTTDEWWLACKETSPSIPSPHLDLLLLGPLLHLGLLLLRLQGSRCWVSNPLQCQLLQLLVGRIGWVLGPHRKSFRIY